MGVGSRLQRDSLGLRCMPIIIEWLERGDGFTEFFGKTSADTGSILAPDDLQSWVAYG